MREQDQAVEANWLTFSSDGGMRRSKAQKLIFFLPKQKKSNGLKSFSPPHPNPNSHILKPKKHPYLSSLLSLFQPCMPDYRPFDQTTAKQRPMPLGSNTPLPDHHWILVRLLLDFHHNTAESKFDPRVRILLKLKQKDLVKMVSFFQLLFNLLNLKFQNC